MRKAFTTSEQINYYIISLEKFKKYKHGGIGKLNSNMHGCADHQTAARIQNTTGNNGPETNVCI